MGRVGWVFQVLRAPRFFLCAPAACGCVLVACRGVAIFVGEGPFGVGVPFLFLFAHPREGACLSFCVVWSVRFYCGWFSCWREG